MTLEHSHIPTYIVSGFWLFVLFDVLFCELTQKKKWICLAHRFLMLFEKPSNDGKRDQ